MIPVFKKLEIKNPDRAVYEIAEHINEMQTELYNCLMNLTSENVTELCLDITKMSSERGSLISGDLIKLKGGKGETLTAGYDKLTGAFELSVKDKDGNVAETMGF